VRESTGPLNRRLRFLVAACACLLVLGGCASDGPYRTQDLTVATATTSSLLYPRCHGRTVRVAARMQPHGSRVDAVRVMVTSRDGVVHPEPPTVTPRGGAVQAVTTDGPATVVWFGCPGPCDGTVIPMTVVVPPNAPCPYRVRLVAVLKAP
jgi:hypothetical protein